jgi:ankyrin repeat protein
MDPLGHLRQIEIVGTVKQVRKKPTVHEDRKVVSVTMRHLPLWKQMDLKRNGEEGGGREESYEHKTAWSSKSQGAKSSVGETDKQVSLVSKAVTLAASIEVPYPSTYSKRPLTAGKITTQPTSQNQSSSDDLSSKKDSLKQRPSTAGHPLRGLEEGEVSRTRVGQSLFAGQKKLPIKTKTSRPTTSGGRINSASQSSSLTSNYFTTVNTNTRTTSDVAQKGNNGTTSLNQRPMTSDGISRITASASTYKPEPLPVFQSGPVTDLGYHVRGPHTNVKGFVQRVRSKVERPSTAPADLSQSTISQGASISQDSVNTIHGNMGMGRYFSKRRTGPGLVHGMFTFPSDVYSAVAGAIRKSATIISTISDLGSATIIMTCAPPNLAFLITEVNSITKGGFSFTTQDAPVPRTVVERYDVIDPSDNIDDIVDEEFDDDDQPWYYCYTCIPGGTGDDILLNGFCKECSSSLHHGHDVRFSAFVVKTCKCQVSQDSTVPAQDCVSTMSQILKVGDQAPAIKDPNRTTPALQRSPEDGLARLLVRSAQRGLVDEVVDLVKRGADINLPSDDVFALSAAAKYGWGDVVSFLLKGGADRTLRNSKNATALDDAHEAYSKAIASGEKEEVCRRIFHCIMLLDTTTAFQAAVSGDLERLKYLVTDRKTDINLTNTRGMSLLHFACLKGHVPMVKWLTQMGADCNKSNNLGQLPEDLALEDRMVQYAVKVGRREQSVRREEEMKRIYFAEKAAAATLAQAAEEKKKRSNKKIEMIHKKRASTLQESKKRHARNYHSRGVSTDSTHGGVDFYLNIWPKPTDPHFDSWSRAHFGT